MSPYRHIERRVDRLLARLGRGVDAGVLDEMEDVLATGYAYALQGDARCRHLGRRRDALAEDIADAGAATELRRLSLEQRALEDSTRRLRARLEPVRLLLSDVSRANRSG
jgi:hypothetical protein